MSSDEEWVKAAMSDDSVVGELLVRLNQAEAGHSSPPAKRNSAALPLGWSIRQRRSKTIPRFVYVKKEGESTRASPTTPLSWSGATSVSGGDCAVDGFEESSRQAKPSNGARSKVTTTSEATTTKRSRKKKTLAELKEEEILLLKERRHLKNELAALRVTFEKQRATNEGLKRMKFDLQSQSVTKTVITSVALREAISNQPQQMEAACDPTPSILPTSTTCGDHDAVVHPSPLNRSTKVQEEAAERANLFLLPDLNLPFEEDSGSKVFLYGMS